MAGSLMTRNRQRWVFAPFAAHTPASRMARIRSSGTGSDFSRRMARVVWMISNRSARSGMALSSLWRRIIGQGPRGGQTAAAPAILAAKHEGGTRRLARHAIGDAGREQRPQSTLARSGQCDQVGLERLGLEENLLERIPEADHALHRHVHELCLDPGQVLQFHG